jgi:uncharacterized membrane protein
VPGGSARAYDYADADPVNEEDVNGEEAAIACTDHTPILHPHRSSHNRGHLNAVVRGRCVGTEPGVVRLRVRTALYHKSQFVKAQVKTIEVPVLPNAVVGKDFNIPFKEAPVCKNGDWQAFATITATYPPGYDEDFNNPGHVDSAKVHITC